MLAPEILLWLLALFAAKHFVCDGPLQTLAMVRAKGHYGRPLGLAHAAIHGAGSFLAALLAGLPPGLAGMLAIADTAIHYHVDFGKEQLLRRTGWTQTDARYWWTFVADQSLHQMTYIALTALALAATI